MGRRRSRRGPFQTALQPRPRRRGCHTRCSPSCMAWCRPTATVSISPTRRASNSAHFCGENTDFPTSLYTEVFYGTRDGEIKGLAYREASAIQFGVHDAAAALGPDYETVLGRSDIYNLICVPIRRPMNFLRLFIRDGRQRKTLGCVDLHPSIGARPWTPEEKRRLARLEPFFAYALTVTCRARRAADGQRPGWRHHRQSSREAHPPVDGGRAAPLPGYAYPRVTPGVAVSRVPVLPAPSSASARTSTAPPRAMPMLRRRSITTGMSGEAFASAPSGSTATIRRRVSSR